MVHRQLCSGMERTYIHIFFTDFPFFSFLPNIGGAISETIVIWYLKKFYQSTGVRSIKTDQWDFDLKTFTSRNMKLSTKDLFSKY